MSLQPWGSWLESVAMSFSTTNPGSTGGSWTTWACSWRLAGMWKSSRRFTLNWIAGSVGVPGGLTLQSQVVAHMSMVAVCPPQTTSTVKQQVVPNGTLASAETDRKSTRLNSSHGYISYAVFCL